MGHFDVRLRRLEGKGLQATWGSGSMVWIGVVSASGVSLSSLPCISKACQVHVIGYVETYNHRSWASELKAGTMTQSASLSPETLNENWTHNATAYVVGFRV